jgi:hypothetical protein
LPVDFPQDRIPHPPAHDALGLADPREHEFRGQVYPTIPLALSMACYKFVKIRSSDKTSNPNPVAAFARSELQGISPL